MLYIVILKRKIIYFFENDIKESFFKLILQKRLKANYLPTFGGEKYFTNPVQYSYSSKLPSP